jgi:hypothetical protein
VPAFICRTVGLFQISSPVSGQIEELMKKCLVQVGVLKEGFVAPVAVAQVTDSILGADSFSAGLFPFFD